MTGFIFVLSGRRCGKKLNNFGTGRASFLLSAGFSTRRDGTFPAVVVKVGNAKGLQLITAKSEEGQ